MPIAKYFLLLLHHHILQQATHLSHDIQKSLWILSHSLTKCLHLFGLFYCNECIFQTSVSTISIHVRLQVYSSLSVDRLYFFVHKTKMLLQIIHFQTDGDWNLETSIRVWTRNVLRHVVLLFYCSLCNGKQTSPEWVKISDSDHFFLVL